MLVPMLKRTWMFEKIEKIKDLVFAKLDEILGKLAAQDAALGSLAANDSSVLQTLVYLVERAQEGHRSTGELSTKIESLQRELAGFEPSLRTNFADVRREIESLASRVSTEPRAGPLTVPTRRQGLLEPESALMAHLAPFLPERLALDVGANVGDVSAALLESGFEVHAFEPNPPTLERLTERLGRSQGFFAYGLAVGSADGSMELHLAQDTSPEKWFEEESLYSSLVKHSLPAQLQFTRSVTVPVRSLSSLHASGLIPAGISLVKIDTEGWDLEVIRGMGDHRYPVVMAEFWDEGMAFSGSGAQNRLHDLALEMRRRGSPWFIVLYRLFPGDERVSYYCNLPASPETSWGNVLFFRDQKTFEEARRWCAATLPPATFSKRLVPAETSDATALANGATSPP